MVVRGRVQNGIIVLSEDVHLPEGQEVTVLTTLPTSAGAHGLLAIPPVSLGSLLRPFSDDDDLLGEMLEGRS